ncbi:glycosyltransferase involved in cell wall biosynthesis [Albidovulum inexpectatum]|uniref:Glycosyltransferase involved in cell wall biosynthesis n=1 Tax=Albidovulum inexpectatum TaxID=196587 RepID=A0A2S5JJ77_9RHOB|nr:glycosyltransferase family 2 protein [Albidovulum inexpectatum]PPB81567.1 glycosyltransferase involved in cell wall biosynthesis [Albidovulum inexpectatum]
MKKISIVSPCFNEEDNVETCYRTVREIFERDLPGYEREHIFVDNASTDRTVEILRRIAAEDPCVKVIVNSRNFGVYRSTFNGLRHATGDATLCMLPVDLQDPPELLPEFVKLWESGYDVVAGARSTREEGFFLRTARKAFYRIVNALSDFELSPDVGEFQLIDRKVLDAVLAHDDNYPYIRGIIASVGFRKVIIPYTWRARKRGMSKHSMMMLTDQALNAIFAFTRAPLRFCSLAGFGIAIFSILFSIVSVVLWFLGVGDAPRGTTTIIVALFFLSGVQLLFIGLMGEYITAIHNQVRGGPCVIEKELINIPKLASVGPERGRVTKFPGRKT